MQLHAALPLQATRPSGGHHTPKQHGSQPARGRTQLLVAAHHPHALPILQLGAQAEAHGGQARARRGGLRGRQGRGGGVNAAQVVLGSWAAGLQRSECRQKQAARAVLKPPCFSPAQAAQRTS